MKIVTKLTNNFSLCAWRKKNRERKYVYKPCYKYNIRVLNYTLFRDFFLHVHTIIKIINLLRIINSLSTITGNTQLSVWTTYAPIHHHMDQNRKYCADAAFVLRKNCAANWNATDTWRLFEIKHKILILK